MGDRREINREKKVSPSVRKAKSSRCISNSAEYVFPASVILKSFQYPQLFLMLFVKNLYIFCNALNNISVHFVDK